MTPRGDSLSRSQRLLLTAALANHEEALQAWQEWCRDFRLDDAGQEEFWILPLIFSHLEGGGFDGPEHGRLKGIYKQTRLRSAMLRPKLSAILECFAEQGIEARAAPLTARVLDDPDSALPLEPAELRCTPDNADSCHRILTDHGWQPERGIPRPDMRAFIGAVTYRQEPLGRIRLSWNGTLNPGMISSIVAWHLEHPGADWFAAPIDQSERPPAGFGRRLGWHWRRYHAVECEQRPATFPSYLYAWHRYFQ